MGLQICELAEANGNKVHDMSGAIHYLAPDQLVVATGRLDCVLSGYDLAMVS